jgi:hypothetical protein
VFKWVYVKLKFKCISISPLNLTFLTLAKSKKDKGFGTTFNEIVAISVLQFLAVKATLTIYCLSSCLAEINFILTSGFVSTAIVS